MSLNVVGFHSNIPTFKKASGVFFLDNFEFCFARNEFGGYFKNPFYFLHLYFKEAKLTKRKVLYIFP